MLPYTRIPVLLVLNFMLCVVTIGFRIWSPAGRKSFW